VSLFARLFPRGRAENGADYFRAGLPRMLLTISARSFRRSLRNCVQGLGCQAGLPVVAEKSTSATAKSPAVRPMAPGRPKSANNLDDASVNEQSTCACRRIYQPYGIQIAAQARQA